VVVGVVVGFCIFFSFFSFFFVCVCVFCRFAFVVADGGVGQTHKNKKMQQKTVREKKWLLAGLDPSPAHNVLFSEARPPPPATKKAEFLNSLVDELLSVLSTTTASDTAASQQLENVLHFARAFRDEYVSLLSFFDRLGPLEERGPLEEKNSRARRLITVAQQRLSSAAEHHQQQPPQEVSSIEKGWSQSIGKWLCHECRDGRKICYERSKQKRSPDEPPTVEVRCANPDMPDCPNRKTPWTV